MLCDKFHMYNLVTHHLQTKLFNHHHKLQHFRKLHTWFCSPTTSIFVSAVIRQKKKVQNIVQIPALPWGEICPYMLWSPSSGFPQLFLSLDQLTLTLFSSTSHCILSAISSCTAGITTAFFGLAAWWGRRSGLSLRSYLLCKAHALHFTSKSHQKSELSTHTHTKKVIKEKGHTTLEILFELKETTRIKGASIELSTKESFTHLGLFHVYHHIIFRLFISFLVDLFNTAVCVSWLPNELSLLLKYCAL